PPTPPALPLFLDRLLRFGDPLDRQMNAAVSMVLLPEFVVVAAIVMWDGDEMLPRDCFEPQAFSFEPFILEHRAIHARLAEYIPQFFPVAGFFGRVDEPPVRDVVAPHLERDRDGMRPSQRLKLTSAENEPLRLITCSCHTLRTAKSVALK